MNLYSIDEADRLNELDLPQMTCGASLPEVHASEASIVLTYFLDDLDVRAQAKIVFTMPLCLYIGPPNDEGLEGHPLHARGLESYRSYEVIDSSWVRAQLARVSVAQTDEHAFKHFILTFHDETFECIARSVSVQ